MDFGVVEPLWSFQYIFQIDRSAFCSSLSKMIYCHVYYYTFFTEIIIIVLIEHFEYLFLGIQN